MTKSYLQKFFACLALTGVLAPGCSLTTHFDDYRPDDPTNDAGTDTGAPVDAGDAGDRDTGRDGGGDAAGPSHTINVTVVGGGTVTDGVELDCDEAGGGTCSGTYAEGSVVTLTAVDTVSARFVGWTGDACDGEATTTCDVTVDADVAITATFEPIEYLLSVSVVGGQARIMTTGATTPALDCDRDGTHTTCSGMYPAGTSITLGVSEIPAGFSFAAWGGDSVGCTAASCTFDLTADTSLIATISDGRPVLSVSASNGTVASDDTLIDCPSGACSAPYTVGSMVRLVPTPDLGYRFVAWTGCGAAMGGVVGADQSCTMTLAMSRSVTAIFSLLQFNVEVARSGGGSGTVTSTLPAGTIACGSDCDELAVDYGTTFVLHPVPASGSRFVSWTGGSCTGLTGDCSFDLTSDVALTATFELITRTLTAHVEGTGSVGSAPAGIACGAGDTGSCSLAVDHGDSVVLTASPATGQMFMGWTTSPGGLCSGTGTCTLNMTQNVTANATFITNQYDLTLMVTGTGVVGNVAVTETGGGSASCSTGGTCTSTWDHGDMLTLTATATGAAIFTGWGGACAGFGASSTCTLTMTAAQSVTAGFAVATSSIQIIKTGGNGTVTSTMPDTRVNCGAMCTVDYAMGTMVTLLATPATGYTFVGWSGVPGCGAAATCLVMVGASATTVTAQFAPLTYTVSVTTTGIPPSSMARVTSDGGAISCPGTCSAVMMHGAALNLTATPDAGANFVMWSSGPCAGSTAAICNSTVTGAVNATAVFTPVQYPLDVAKAVGGQGTITVTGVSPAITCGPSCLNIHQDINFGTMVTLTATPDSMNIFAGWTGGGCSGTAPCTVPMNMARSITATFRQPIITVNVTASAGALGGGPAVASTMPSGLIRCGGSSSAATACTGSVPRGTVVTLAPQRGWLAIGAWGSPSCGDENALCSVSVTADVTLNIQMRQRGNLVFPTSVNASAMSATTADAQCGSAAGAAGLPGTYRAWISLTSTQGALARLTPEVTTARSVGWVRPDGFRVAYNFSEFGSGRLTNPLVVLADGSLITTNAPVWTGTTSTGNPGANCTNWTATTGGAISGSMDRSGTTWTENPTTLSCGGGGSGARFYCMQVDGGDLGFETPPREQGNEVYVFVHSDTAPGSVTLATMASLCDADADALALDGRYTVFVTTSSRGATGVTSLLGPVVRADGWPIAPSVAALGNEGNYLATSFGGVQVIGSGLSLTSGLAVWTGMPNAGPEVSATTNTCTNWTAGTASVFGMTGLGDSARFPIWGQGLGAVGCNLRNSWYCIRETL